VSESVWLIERREIAKEIEKERERGRSFIRYRESNIILPFGKSFNEQSRSGSRSFSLLCGRTADSARVHGELPSLIYANVDTSTRRAIVRIIRTRRIIGATERKLTRRPFIARLCRGDLARNSGHLPKPVIRGRNIL